MATVIRERSSSIRIGRQFLSCSSLRVLLASHLLQEYFHIISISPHPSLACLLCMAHYKLGAGWWACPGLLFPAGWWLSPPPKGQSSSPFRLSCSISLLSWWIFVIMRFFYWWFFWVPACCLLFLPILSNAQPWLFDRQTCSAFPGHVPAHCAQGSRELVPRREWRWLRTF